MVIRDEVRRAPAYHFRHHPQPVKLDQNEAPDDAGAVLAKELAEAVATLALNRYPQLHPVDLEVALAERLGCDPDGVVVAAGSNVLIQAIVIAAGLGRTVLTVAPTFAVYASQARLLGADLIEVPLGERFALPEEELTAALTGRAGVAFLADPAAPTGNRLDAAGVERFATAAAATGSWLTVLDEAYVDFADGDHLGLARRLKNVAVLRTFSKAAGLAGARLGYLLTTPDLATQVRKVLLPFSVGALQVAAGLLALRRPDLVETRVRVAKDERRRLAAALSLLPGIEVFPSETNFVLFRVADPAGVHTALLERGVVVRRQDHLPGLAGCLRVTAGHPHENDAFLNAMESAVTEGAHADG
ncbi:MAG TPA: aminotransferase class I/II-fold pyridoxal phosphate-dependent enzyme [Trueperaceae bacterium]